MNNKRTYTFKSSIASIYANVFIFLYLYTVCPKSPVSLLYSEVNFQKVENFIISYQINPSILYSSSIF